jgi:hypothetical protein
MNTRATKGQLLLYAKEHGWLLIADDEEERKAYGVVQFLLPTGGTQVMSYSRNDQGTDEIVADWEDD